eukprot:g1349.t1 g1349   contig10:1903258-1904547(-)
MPSLLLQTLCIWVAILQGHAFNSYILPVPQSHHSSSPVRTSLFNPSLTLTCAQTADDTSQVKQSNRKSKNATKWIACSSTKEVTRAIERYVQGGDRVAELGSQLREPSSMICEMIGASGKAMLVDIERKFPNEKKGSDRTSAMRREGDEDEFYNDRATFRELKTFDGWRHALLSTQYNILVVDVSIVAGNDLDLTCISLIKEFIALNSGSGDNIDNPCRAIIVKSGSLHNLARRLYHAQTILSGSRTIRLRENEQSSVVGAVGLEEYRRTIPFVVRKGDVCVEVGCHLGTSTTIIDEAAKDTTAETGGCLGVDVGPHIIERAKEKYPHLPFEVGDGFEIGSLIRMRSSHFPPSTNHSIYDVVYVDIGGLSGSEGLLEAVSLLSSITNCLEPRCIVIKSLCVRRLASCLVPFSEVWRKEKMAEQANTEPK